MAEHLNLFITVMVAWLPTGATPDSIGAKPFFSQTSYENCHMFDSDDAINTCYQLVQASNEKNCEKKAYEFSDKHKLSKDRCIKMKRKKYNKHYANVKAEFYAGPLWPKCGGHICKKNRKGKLYACIKIKEKSKAECQ